MLAVIRVHNNHVGKCKSVQSQDEGISLVKEWAEEKLNRKLTEKEIESIENNAEIYNEDDADNQWVVALMEVEE